VGEPLAEPKALGEKYPSIGRGEHPELADYRCAHYVFATATDRHIADMPSRLFPATVSHDAKQPRYRSTGAVT
jgi:hypothetical protein